MLKSSKLKTNNYKLITILGPTASGKSELAVKLAQKFNGEIISADSRQVYRGMDIGTGKVPRDKNWKLSFAVAKRGERRRRGFLRTLEIGNWKLYYHKGIPHYLLDVASPKRRFTVAQYRNLAIIAINKIQEKNKIPILCGGTGFYIQAVVDGIIIPEVKPDWKLRKKLEKKSVEELYKILKKLDPQRAKIIERKNPRRLIRAIEIVIKTKKPVPAFKKNPLPYPVLMIGIKKEKKELSSLIRRRLLRRLKKGMIAEVKKLRESGVSWRRLEEFGLEYRWLARFLQKKINYQEMIERLQKDTEHFAKRQMTWFKRDKRINWIETQKEAEKLVTELSRSESEGEDEGKLRRR